MNRTAVFVDAGYLFAAGSLLVSGSKLSRGQINLDYDAILKFLAQKTQEITQLPLLRIYWYDGTSTGPTPAQLALAYRPNVKLRLGFVTSHGEQKGVDALIINDLITLARNHAIADAILLTGDGDISYGVKETQTFGVRVHLLGIAPVRENQSGILAQDADTITEISEEEVKVFLTRNTYHHDGPSSNHKIESLPALNSDHISLIEREVQRIVENLNDSDRKIAIEESQKSSIPSHIDRELIVSSSQALGNITLLPDHKKWIRTTFHNLINQ